jgi:hypothetical protein
MSFVFTNQYGWNETQTGLAFLGIGGGSLLGLYVVYLWSDRIAAALTKRHGIQKPEVDSLCNCADLSVSPRHVLLLAILDAVWFAYIWMVF